MRVYEELFIIKPGTPDEEVDGYVTQVQELITSGQGTVDKTEKWGTRKLAYRVQKFSEGIYVLIQFSAPADLVREVERRMRNTDTVIKFITVRVDERLKKVTKRKSHREKRAARKPPPQVAVPIAPAEPAPVPGAPAPGAPVPGAPAPGAPAPTTSSEPKAAE